jgi:hypothetical protein
VIPGLLHTRLLDSSGGGSVVAAPPYGNLSAADSGLGSRYGVSTLELIVKPDGSWIGDSSSAGDGSGNWYLPTTASIGVGHEVRFTPTRTAGTTAVITNDAATWASLSAERSILLKLSRYTVGVSEAAYNVLVEIRESGGAIVSSGTAKIFLSAAAEGDDPPDDGGP